MKNKLLIIFLILLIIKILLVIIIPAPSAFSDEYTYSKLARSFFNEQEFTIHEIQDKHKYPPLYPILISPAYLAKDMNLIYLIIKLINVIISTSIIFPIYLLAKEFITEKKALFTSLIISLAPPIFSFPQYILSENLFYPLVAFTIYFIYKSFTINTIFYSILSGLFISLSYLTRNIGIILIIIPILTFIIIILRDKQNKNLVKNISIIYLITITIIGLWILRNYLLFGPTLADIFGNVGSDDITSVIRDNNYFLVLINWIILYTGFLIISTGILPSISFFNLFKQDNKKLKVLLIIGTITILLFILISANHATGARDKTNPIYESPFSSIFTERPIGRYIDATLPILMLLGIIGLTLTPTLKIHKYIIPMIILISTQLVIAPLFPVNNMSLTHLGMFKYMLDNILNINGFSWIVFIIIAAILITITLVIMHKRNFKILYLIGLVFILTSLLNYGITYHNAKTGWYDKPQMQLGLWLNDNDKAISNILIDKRYKGKITKDNQEALHDDEFFTPLGFWLNDNIKIGDVNDRDGMNYIITKDKLNLQLIKEYEGIKIYKNE